MNQLSIINYLTLYVILQQLETAPHGNQGSDKIKPWNSWNLNTSENRKKVTWSSKHACALPDTKSEIWEKLQVEISHLMVTTPRENIPA